MDEPLSEWTSHWCKCDGFCWYANVCPCFAYADVAIKHQPHRSWWQNCVGCILCPAIALMLQRDRIRVQYHIDGHPCIDFCVTQYCTGCTLAQQMREVEGQGRLMAVGRPPVAQLMPEPVALSGSRSVFVPNGSQSSAGYQQVATSDAQMG